MNCGVILLAAGRSRRFEGDKRLALLPNGQTILNSSIDNIQTAGLPLLVCLRAEDEQLSQQLNQQHLHTICCKHSNKGMASSLAEGVATVANWGWEGALIALADMPFIAPNSISAVANSLRVNTIVVPHYQRQAGHPVAFAKSFFPALAQLQGDGGAKMVVQENIKYLTSITLDDPNILFDIDTVSQYQQINSPSQI